MILIPGVWLIFLIHFRCAHVRFSSIRSAPWRTQFSVLVAANIQFFASSLLPHRRGMKKRTHRFLLVICGLPQAFSVDLRLAAIVYSGGKG
jgi:uncharacterized membrane protein SirB2